VTNHGSGSEANVFDQDSGCRRADEVAKVEEGRPHAWSQLLYVANIKCQLVICHTQVEDSVN
jgi:hypothetical protein